MDPFTLIVVGGTVAGVAALLDALNSQKPSPSERSRDEIRRIGDETITEVRRLSTDFREHIDRETRR